MSEYRDLDKRFLKAMIKKLAKGRDDGKVGWDDGWDNCSWPTCEGGGGNNGALMTYLRDEVVELTLALERGKKPKILSECADIANFAMMVADYHEALDAKVEEAEEDDET